MRELDDNLELIGKCELFDGCDFIGAVFEAFGTLALSEL